MGERRPNWSSGDDRGRVNTAWTNDDTFNDSRGKLVNNNNIERELREEAAVSTVASSGGGSGSGGGDQDSGIFHDLDAPVFGTYRRKTSLYNFGLGNRVTPVNPPAGNNDNEVQVCSCGYVFTGDEEEDSIEGDQDRDNSSTAVTGGSSSSHYYRHFESPAETLDRRCTVRADNVFELRQFGKFEGAATSAFGTKGSSEGSGRRMKRAPKIVRLFLAEFLGTLLLVLFGDGAIGQFVYLQQEPGGRNFLSVALGYGLALMIGILVSGGVSGGHLNPAVTLSMAVLNKLRWVYVPLYWGAQYLGAFVGAALVFGLYTDGISAYGTENGEKVIGAAGIFASYPGGVADPNVGVLILDQCVGTACLLIIILAVTDERNMKVASGLVPLLIGLGLAAIHISMAFNAGCAINPARDLSPRLFTMIAGWGTEPFTANDSFFWIPWIMPHIGGVVGALTYHFLVSFHHDNDL